MTTTLRALAELVGGELHGDADLPIHSAGPVSETQPGQITFLECEKYLPLFNAGSATAAILPHGMSVDRPFICVDEPLKAFVAIVHYFQGFVTEPVHGIDPMASVHPTAIVGAGASVHAFASIGAGCVVGKNCRIRSGVNIGRNSRVGDDVTLHPNVVLYDRTVLGDRVIVHSNTVIGADGFGYRFQNGQHVKVPQLGNVEIGDDVEIGACTTIDRGTFGATRIGAGTKIDNLVQVAHNCQVGRHNIFVSQVGMAGSSSTGDEVVIAGQVGVIEHVHIGERSVIGGQAAIIKDVPPDSRMLGSPATPEKEQKRILMTIMRLPEIRKEIRTLQEKLGMVG